MSKTSAASRLLSILVLATIIVGSTAGYLALQPTGKQVDPSTVGTSTANDATSYPFQRKSFYANGRFWVFYSDGTNMVYCTSTDGSTWSSATTVRAASAGYKFSVWFDGTYLHYAYAHASSIYYRRGTPNADRTITWSAVEQTVSTTYNKASYPMVSVDSNGYVWIGYQDYTGTYYYPYVIKSGNNDGTWGTTPSGFPYQLSTTSSSDWKVSPIPLTAGKMLAVYTYDIATVKAKRWDGSAWGTEVTTASLICYGEQYSAVAQGDDVHLTFLKYTTCDIIYVKYTYSSNSFGTETTLQAGATTTSAPVLSIDTATNDLYVFAATKTTGTPSGWTANHIYYKKYTASSSTWGSWTDWIDETTGVLTSADRLTCFYKAYGNYIGLVYMTKTASPYNIKFAYLSPNTAPNTPTLNSPAANYRFNPSASVTFTWTFSDPDAGDYQTAYQFQLDNDSDFSSPITDSNKVSSASQQTAQTLPSTVGLYYWRVKTWDSKDAGGPYCTGREIIVDRIKITACGILNNVVDTRTGGTVWYRAVYEYDNTPFTGSCGTLYLNGTAMGWTTDCWTRTFSYQMSGSQAVFIITSVAETNYGLTAFNNVAGNIVLDWATMEITISKP